MLDKPESALWSPRSRSTGWTLLFFAIVAVAAYLRLYDIGEHGFWTDELFHVFAAKSYLDHGSFEIPWSAQEYTRALPVTLVTAFAFKTFGEGEASARVFFALSNILFLVVAGYVVRALFSSSIALLFALSTALSVVSIQLSQECRMYTVFQLLYFLTVVTFLLAIEPPASGSLRRLPGPLGAFEKRTGTSLALLGASIVLAGLSLVLQPLVVNFVLVIGAYGLIMLGYEARQTGFRPALRTRYAGVLIAIAATLVVCWVVKPGVITGVVRLAMESPAWNMPTRDRWSFYNRVIIDSHPIFWALYPLGAFLLIRRYGRRGLFFVLSFAVLFPVHCFAFGRKSERYIFYILPFLVTSGAVAADFLIAGAARLGSKWAASLSRPLRLLLYVAVAAAILGAAVPLIRQVMLDAAVEKFPDWKHLDRELVRTVSRSTAITTDRMGFTYYFGGQPIILDSAYFEADAGVIRTVDDFKRIVELHPDYHLVTYASHLDSPAFVSPEVRDYILRETDRVDDRKNDRRIMVFAARR